jgi:hypothetical protein
MPVHMLSCTQSELRELRVSCVSCLYTCFPALKVSCLLHMFILQRLLPPTRGIAGVVALL